MYKRQGFIGYLPVPVLTAIVISALLGATEFELAVKLWKVSRTECFIFWGAFIGVLLLGTINGVLIGIILSFAEMVIRSSKPASCFLGIQPGHKHFRDLAESRQIHEIEGVLILSLIHISQAKEALAKVIGEAHNLEVENSNN